MFIRALAEANTVIVHVYTVRFCDIQQLFSQLNILTEVQSFINAPFLLYSDAEIHDKFHKLKKNFLERCDQYFFTDEGIQKTIVDVSISVHVVLFVFPLLQL